MKPHAHRPEVVDKSLIRLKARIVANWYKHHTNTHRYKCRWCAKLYRAALKDMLAIGKQYHQSVSAYDKRAARTTKKGKAK